uniref:Xylulose kinase-1 n=1 Tax=Tanacetum cinerariifolium TaxID=118510 RepID=A0A699IML0_TANCI|nr:hypothetical protein [Tanacetum cinerariifolium]
MTNLEFCDNHNIVAFLKKPQGSEDFHQIVDFINASHIRYALTKNPTIYVSLINQFWRIASARTLDNGEIELNATVDGQDTTITETSVRRHLKLADADGIRTLPTTKIFEQLALMGYVTNSDNLTFQKNEAITKEMHDGLGRATTTASSLKAQGSPVQARPRRLSNLANKPPLREDKVTTLENELKSTKGVYNKALITLTKRVKKLEKKLKHKRRRTVIDSSKDEEATGHRMESDDTKVVDFSTASPQKYNDEITLAKTLMNIKKSVGKDKGGDTLKPLKHYSFEKIKMLFDKIMESIRKFVPIESEGQVADFKASEGRSKKGERLKRPDEEELGQEQQTKQKVKEDLSQEKLQQMMVIIPKQGIHVEALQTKEDLVKLWSLVKERFSSSNPTKDKEINIWIKLKRLFKPDEDDELWKFESFELIWRLAVVDSSNDEEESLDKKDSPKQRMMIKEIDEDENVNLVKSSEQGEVHETAGHRMKSVDTEVVNLVLLVLKKMMIK